MRGAVADPHSRWETAPVLTRRRTLVWLLLISITLLAGGCGGEDQPEPRPQPAETVDPLPELPRGWREHVNHEAGFAIGVPPGWSARARGTSSLFRSPDRLVAVSVSADRTVEALRIPLEDYATEATRALPGFKDLEVGEPRPFQSRYEGVAVPAAGREAKSGVRQRLLFVAMRRDDLATYPVLVASNARRARERDRSEALRMMRTLRGRPVSG